MNNTMNRAKKMAEAIVRYDLAMRQLAEFDKCTRDIFGRLAELLSQLGVERWRDQKDVIDYYSERSRYSDAVSTEKETVQQLAQMLGVELAASSVSRESVAASELLSLWVELLRLRMRVRENIVSASGADDGSHEQRIAVVGELEVRRAIVYEELLDAARRFVLEEFGSTEV